MTQRSIDILTASEKLEMGRPCKQNEDNWLNTARETNKGKGVGRRCRGRYRPNPHQQQLKRPYSKREQTAEVVNMSHMPLLHDRSIFTPLFAFQQKIFF